MSLTRCYKTEGFYISNNKKLSRITECMVCGNHDVTANSSNF